MCTQKLENACNYIAKKIVKITNLLVSTVARNSGNSNLFGCVGCYFCIVIYVHTIIIQ